MVHKREGDPPPPHLYPKRASPFTGWRQHHRDPASNPNAVRPGKRPFYTLNPGIALKNGTPHVLYGTQGADGQPQTLSLLLTGLLDYGMTPMQALAQSRFLLGRTFSDAHDSLKLEQSLGDNTITKLAALGHDVLLLPALSPIFGQAGIICIHDEGWIIGSHDPRGDGVAISVQQSWNKEG